MKIKEKKSKRACMMGIIEINYQRRRQAAGKVMGLACKHTCMHNPVSLLTTPLIHYYTLINENESENDVGTAFFCVPMQASLAFKK